MKDIPYHDHTRESTLFQIEGMITKPTKPQENDLINLTAAAIFDFMSQIKKIYESEIKLQVCNISDMFKSAYKDVKFA